MKAMNVQSHTTYSVFLNSYFQPVRPKSINITLPELNYSFSVKNKGHSMTKYRMSEKECTHLNAFVEKINRARSVQFSPHETATQKVVPPPFFISLRYTNALKALPHIWGVIPSTEWTMR
jgi:hypothetical protein